MIIHLKPFQTCNLPIPVLKMSPGVRPTSRWLHQCDRPAVAEDTAWARAGPPTLSLKVTADASRTVRVSVRVPCWRCRLPSEAQASPGDLRARSSSGQCQRRPQLAVVASRLRPATPALLPHIHRYDHH